MSEDARMQAGVTKIIARFGAEFTVSTCVGEPVYDPETSTTTENRVTYTIMGVALDYKQQINGWGTNTNTQILSGDKQFWCNPITAKIAGVASAFAPDPSTTEVVVGIDTYKVVNIKSVNPSGNNVIAYEFQLRK